ncbi:MAG: ribokinase [Rhodospirillaceae bacterium]
MAVTNFGSINIDKIYRVSQFLQPGETRLVAGHQQSLGGKGANQSIALAKAGSAVRHIGNIGPDGGWTAETLAAAAVDIDAIAKVQTPTGHAVIQVDDAGENCILVDSGANVCLTEAQISAALTNTAASDWVLLQNETNLTGTIAAQARAAGHKVCYSAAPFVAAQTLPLLGTIDLLVVNALEAEMLAQALAVAVDAIPVPAMVITKGADGAVYTANRQSAQAVTVTAPAFPVEVVDTTGAGDTFLGFFLSALETGRDPAEGLRRAAAAAALQVTKPGAAAAIPDSATVDAFLRDHPAS